MFNTQDEKNVFLIIIFFSIIVVGLTITQTIFHEDAHLEIDRIYGCKSSYIDYSFLYLSGQTYSVDCPSETNLERWQLHAENEVSGYQYRIIMLSILFGTLLVAISILLYKERTN